MIQTLHDLEYQDAECSNSIIGYAGFLPPVASHTRVLYRFRESLMFSRLGIVAGQSRASFNQHP